MPDDYIPQPDDAFVHWADAFRDYCTANNTDLGLSTADVTAITNAVQPIDSGWTAKITADTAAKAANATFDERRAASEPVLRQFAQILQANPNVTDADRVELGLTVRKKHGTPVGPIDTWPVLYRVDQEPLRHRLWFSDSATPGSKAKPAGALFCEIRELLVAAGGAAPTDPDAMPFLCTETKSPHRNDFDASERGHTAYYAQRWVNTRQQPGPWGPITGYPVV